VGNDLEARIRALEMELGRLRAQVVVVARTIDEVLTAAKEPLTTRQICQRTSMELMPARAALKAAVEAGTVRRSGTGNSTYWTLRRAA